MSVLTVFIVDLTQLEIIQKSCDAWVYVSFRIQNGLDIYQLIAAQLMLVFLNSFNLFHNIMYSVFSQLGSASMIF